MPASRVNEETTFTNNAAMKFQSDPSPKAGVNQHHPAPRGQLQPVSIRPQPEGWGELKPTSLPVALIVFQSDPSPKAGVNPAAASRGSTRPSCFNPTPARRL